MPKTKPCKVCKEHMKDGFFAGEECDNCILAKQQAQENIEQQEWEKQNPEEAKKMNERVRYYEQQIRKEMDAKEEY